MILEELVSHYNRLANDPDSDVALPGYSKVGVSLALNISPQGDLLDVICVMKPKQFGKETKDVPTRMIVPQRVVKSSNINPNFLCENSAYMLGITNKGDDAYARKRFEAFRTLHEDILSGVGCPAAKAVLAFLQQYDPATGREHPAIAPKLDAMLNPKGCNLVFLYQGSFVQDDPDIRRAWESYKFGQPADMGQCLVTGEYGPIERVHGKIKGVHGARPGGASLVSFNHPAHQSYGKEQGANAPVSVNSAAAYTKVLDYMLSEDNPNRKLLAGDTTVIYWAENEQSEYAETFAAILDPDSVRDAQNGKDGRKEAEQKLAEVADKIRKGENLDLDALLSSLDDGPTFYVLGLAAPVESRVTVRFFHKDPFRQLASRMMQHYSDLEIVKEFPNEKVTFSVWRIMTETIPKKAKETKPSPRVAEALAQAILTGEPYPESLYLSILQRVRADSDGDGVRKIGYIRAAILKAFLLRKYRGQPNHPYLEVLAVSLNQQSKVPAYLLGRLFAVLEKAQEDAIPGIQTTIKDRFFSAASTSPSGVFPHLLQNGQHHIAKAKREKGRDFQWDVQAILDLLDFENNAFPSHLSTDEQGIFALGYYHQRAYIFTPKAKRAGQETPSTETK